MKNTKTKPNNKDKIVKVNKMIYISLSTRDEIEKYCNDTGYGFSEVIEMMWAIHKKKYLK